MKIKLLLVVLILCIPFAYSTLEIGNIEQAYNIGESIVPQVNISTNTSFSGFIQAEIRCESYSNDYYKFPISFDAQIKRDIPPLTVFENMLGECRLEVSLENLEKEIVASSESSEFRVSDIITAEIEIASLFIRPGSVLQLTGSLLNIRSKPISGTVTATLNGQNYEYVIQTSPFQIDVPIPSDIKSGENRILFSFEDEYKNYVDNIVDFEIIPEPQELTVTLDNDVYVPHEKFTGDIGILDQAGQPLERTVKISILKDSEEVYEIEQITGSFSFTFDNSFVPGTYRFKAAYNDLEDAVDFEVSSLKQLSSTVSDQKAMLENTGNIDYEDKASVIIIKGGEEIVLEKTISLKPGETYEIDLSKEVAEGIYSVILPNGKTINDVYLEDHRSMAKKTVSGLGSVTGNVIKGVESPGLGLSLVIVFVILVIIIALLGYLRVPVISKIKEVPARIRKKFRKY